MAKEVTIKNPSSFYKMVVLIPKENWYVVEGERKPSIECPICGEGILGDNAPHRFYEDGTVKASVVCQNKYCTFHAFVKLEGWNKIIN